MRMIIILWKGVNRNTREQNYEDGDENVEEKK